MGEGRRLVRTEGIHDDGEDYTAFMFQVREAGKEASNVYDLSCRLADIMCSSLCVTVFVGVSMAIPLTMFSIGVKYWEDCPKDERVPVYLIVGGCCGLVKLIATLWWNIQTRRHRRLIDEPDVEGAFTNQTFRTMDTLLLLFLIGWQVAGTIWTFNIWRPRFEPLLHEPSNWCDRTVYMFAVYQLSSTYAATFVFMFLLVCMGEGRRLMRTEGIHDDGKVYTTFMFQVREAGKEACNVFHLSCQLANIMCSSRKAILSC
ncbi:transmembrane protein 272-like [Mya arenaria]|uniref:transmembrane protein 272-like n=1 Tax=Mya arenaria TaxID=6604 RepID=UPI0022DF5192|nr:transmembrane protein 272-like [Mya arenaria]